MKRLLVIIIFGTMSFSHAVFAMPIQQDEPTKFNHNWNYNWFIDSESGSDSNTGTTYGSPLRTISAWSAKGAGASEKVGLRSGSWWRESMNLPASNMTVAAYDSGAKPLLDASDPISTSTWSKTNGYTYTYNASTTNLGAGATTIWVWEDNVRLTSQTSIANVDSNPGSFYVVSNTANPISLYIHSSDNSDPRSNGRSYEYSIRKQGINSDYDGTTYIGIRARRGNNSDGAMRSFTNTFILDSLSEEGSVHNYYIAGGSKVWYSTAHNGGFGMFVFHAGAPANGSDGEFIGLNTYNDSTSYVTGATSFYSHTGGLPDKFGTVTIRRMTTNNVRGPEANEVNNFILDDIMTTNASSSDGVGVMAAQSGVGTTTITNSYFGTIGTGRIFTGTGTASSSLILNNVVATSTTAVTLFYSSAAGTILDISSSTLPNGGILATGAGSSLNIHNNTWLAPSVNDGTVTLHSLSGVTPGNLVMDYNSYLGGNFATIISTTTYYTLPSLRSVLGKELNSTPASSDQLIPSSDSVDMTTSLWSQSGAQGATRTANTITENTQVSSVHGAIYSSNSISGTPIKANGLYTVSAEVKPNGRNWVSLSFASSGSRYVFFDIQNGVTGSVVGAAPYAYGISALDNGYYKVWVSYYAISNLAANKIYMSMSTGDGVSSYTGNGSSGIYNRLTKISEGGSPL